MGTLGAPCHLQKFLVKFGGSLVAWLPESGEDGGNTV